jgi:hypothetical protein
MKKEDEMEFNNVFKSIGDVLINHDAYLALKKEYEIRGYSSKKAQYAAMGCMSGRSQGPTCTWYRKNGQVIFERTA